MIRIRAHAARLLTPIGVALIALATTNSISARPTRISNLPPAARQIVASSIDESLDSIGIRSDRSINGPEWNWFAVALAERRGPGGTARARIIAGEYVPITNVFMTLAGASLDAADDPHVGALEQRLVASELAESNRGNKDHLGFMDPGWKENPTFEAYRIEDHATAFPVVSMRVVELLGSSDYREHGLRVWREPATCDNARCKTASCGYWAGDPARCQATKTAAHCAFRPADPLARDRRTRYLENVLAIGSFRLFATAVDAPLEAPKQRKR